MAFWFFLEVPRNSKSFNFGFFSVSNIFTCFILEMPNFQYTFFLVIFHFSISESEFWGIPKIKEELQWHNANKFSFTCFLAHFKVHPVSMIRYYVFRFENIFSEDIKIRIDHAESRIKNLCSGYAQIIPSVCMLLLLIIFQRFLK